MRGIVLAKFNTSKGVRALLWGISCSLWLCCALSEESSDVVSPPSSHMDTASDVGTTDVMDSNAMPPSSSDVDASMANTENQPHDSLGDMGGGPPEISIECLPFEGSAMNGSEVWQGALGTAAVSSEASGGCQRSYVMTTTAALKDNLPSNPRTVVERPEDPSLRTGHAMFDALYALALAEVVENSVEVVSDGGFQNGQPVSCGAEGCFETGRKWTYVWTRDTAYAVDLGLAGISPLRSRNSLLFKVSTRRDGSMPQLVQDTGSGGSWPVSTDRVSWVLGAKATLAHLDGEERATFLEQAAAAVVNTVLYDREHVFDEEIGLYRGEQSFLDWREQSYPAWTKSDVSDIAMSYALSTNVLHYEALKFAAAVTVDNVQALQFESWAVALKGAMNSRLWLPDDGLYSTFIPTRLDPSPTHQYDALGLSLAVLSGIADDNQAQSVLEKFPHYGPGVPVLWPQQQDTPIYHNRGEWPFVTAYWLRAAAAANNDAVATRMMTALVRGAALNLSNMENFEAGSGANFLSEGGTSGPVVNSQRQLWSVAGYLSMVQHTLFGVKPIYRYGTDSVEIECTPYLPRAIRRAWFKSAETLVLRNLPLAGKRVSVVLHLPEDSGNDDGAYTAGEIRVDGVVQTDHIISLETLAEISRIDVFLELPAAASAASLREESDSDYRNVFGPRAPAITTVESVSNGLEVSLNSGGDAATDLELAIYRDGQLVAEKLPGDTKTWVDLNLPNNAGRGVCYTVEARFKTSGNRSQHARPVCYWGKSGELVQSVQATSFEAVGGQLVDNHGRWHYQNWGQAGHSLKVGGLVAGASGRHHVQLTYGNGSGPINTGITCAVKTIRVVETESGVVVAERMVAMPQLGAWTVWADSTMVAVELSEGVAYDVWVLSSPDVYNMSELAHFSAYTGGEGGVDGSWNYVNIAELKLLPW